MGTAVSTGTSPPYDRPAVDLSLLAVRVVAGVIFAAHGAQKLLGAFGGPGLEKTVEMMGPVAYPPLFPWLLTPFTFLSPPLGFAIWTALGVCGAIHLGLRAAQFFPKQGTRLRGTADNENPVIARRLPLARVTRRGPQGGAPCWCGERGPWGGGAAEGPHGGLASRRGGAHPHPNPLPEGAGGARGDVGR